MTRIAVIGAGGHAKVVMDALIASGISVWGVLDDNPEIWGSDLLGIPIRGPIAKSNHDIDSFVLGIGDNLVRRRIASEISAATLTVVHPSAVVSPSAHVGSGSVLLATAVVQADAHVASGCIVNTGATIEHDCRVGAFSHIAPHAVLNGGVHVGEVSLIGSGAVILPGVSIGDGCAVGAGAVVVSNVPDGATVVGIPAR